MDLAVSILSCSALPSEVEAEVFLEVLPIEYTDRLEVMSAMSQGLVENYFKAGGYSALLHGIALANRVVEDS